MKYEYFAFLSYSRVDRLHAIKIRKVLEGVSIPSDLVKILPDGLEQRKNIRPVFLDEDELPSAVSLPDALKEYLKKSAYLIVLCSPNSAKSEWVNEEVEFFISLGRRDKILCIIVDGEADYYSVAKPNGAVPHAFQAESPYLPALIADIRTNATSLRRETMTLAANMLGVGVEMLVRRERRRTLRLAAISALACVGVVAPVTFFLLGAQHSANQFTKEAERAASQARNEERRASVSNSVVWSQQSDLAFEAKDYRAALALALEGMPDPAKGIDRPLEPKAQAALSRAVWGLENVATTSEQQSPNGEKQCQTTLVARHLADGVWCLGFDEHDALMFRTKNVTTLIGNVEGFPVVADATFDGAMFAFGTNKGYAYARYSDGTTTAFRMGVKVGPAAADYSTPNPSSDDNAKADASVVDIKVSSDGLKVATIDNNGFVRIWNKSGGQLFSKQLPQSALSVSFSPDGHFFVVGTIGAGFVFREDGQLMFQASFPDLFVGAGAISADGKLVAFGLSDKTVRIWSMEGKETSSVPDPEEYPTSLNFSGNVKYLLVSGKSDTLSLIDVTQAREVGSLTLPNSSVGNQKAYFTDSEGSQIFLYDLESVWRTRPELYTIAQDQKLRSGKHDLDVNLTRELFASSGDSVNVFRISGEFVRSIGEGGGPFSSVRFNADGTKILAILAKGSARILDIKDINLDSDLSRAGQQTLQGTVSGGAIGSSVEPRSVDIKVRDRVILQGQFSPDGSLVLTTSSDGFSRLWSNEGALLAELKAYSGNYNNTPGVIFKAHFSRSSKRVITVAGGKEVMLWDSRGRLLSTFGPSAGVVLDAEIAADDSKIVTLSNDKRVTIWRADGVRLSDFVSVQPIDHVEFVGTSNDVFISGDVYSAVRRSDDGRMSTIVEGRGSITADGRVVAAAANESVTGYDLEGNRLFSVKGVSGEIRPLAGARGFISNDGLVIPGPIPLGQELVSLAKQKLNPCLYEVERQKWNLPPVDMEKQGADYCK